MLIKQTQHKNFKSKLYTDNSGYNVAITSTVLEIHPLYGRVFGPYIFKKSAEEKIERLVKELDSL